MAYLRVPEARAAAVHARAGVQKSADQILREEKRQAGLDEKFEVFLSHSYEDADLILGVKKIIEGLGLTVYVDWIDDPKLDRSKVTKETAAVLRLRMRTCSSLVVWSI